MSGESGGLGGLCQRCLLQTTLKIDGATVTPGGGDLFAALEAEANLVAHLSGFADYELLEEIARGGMGIVFKARQRGLNRIVALKMIAAGQLAKPEDIARFRNEAEAAARFQHPNLVPVYEVGEHDGQPWFSMEYVAGPSLAKEVRAGPLAPERAARLMQAVAGAVQHAHDHGILHRDLKPSNILIEFGTVPRVTDFGLAKFAQHDSGITRTDGIVGSPGYMSPEQASAGSVDNRSDVYSLGAVLYEMLTGRPPFQASTPIRTLRLVIETEPVPPARFNPGVPRDLETICLKCLAKEPARLYSTARELAAELEAFLENRPIRARPTSRMERVVRWCRRKPALAAALTALVLALGSGIGGVLWQWRRATLLATRETRQRWLAERNSYAADMLLIDRALKDRNFGYVDGLLARHDPSGKPEVASDRVRPDYRNWEWRHFKSRLPSDELFILGTCSNRVTAVAISPAGRRVAAGDSDGWVNIWDVESRALVQRIRGLALVDNLQFSPDQKWLVCGTRNGSTQLFDTTNWSPGATIDSPRSAIAAFTPDGRHLHLGSRVQLTAHDLVSGKLVSSRPLRGVSNVAFDANALRVAMMLWNGDGCFLDLATFEGVTNRQPDLINRYHVSLTVSPDGRQAVATYNDNTAWVWDFVTGKLRHELRNHTALIFRTAFSPDSRTLVTAGTDQVIGLWDVESGAHRGLLQGHRAAVTAVSFFPDGRRLVSGSRDRTVRVWDIGAADKGLGLTQDLVGATDFVLSPDGSLIWHGVPRQHWTVSDPFAEPMTVAEGKDPDVVSGAGSVHRRRFALAGNDGRVSTWHRTPLGFQPDRSFDAHPGGVRWVAYSPDEQLLASIGNDESVAIWDVVTLDLIKRIPLQRKLGRTGPPRFSPDSQRITLENPQTGSSVLDWRTGQWLGPFNGQTDPVTHSAVSPDGSHLAVVGHDGVTRLWDLREPDKSPRQMSAPETGIWSACFFPDGERLAVGLDSGEIVLWDVVTDREVLRLLDDPIPALAMAFNPEFDALVTINVRGVRVWPGRSLRSQRLGTTIADPER